MCQQLIILQQMRKTVLYWEPKVTTMLEPEREKLKTLCVSYPQLTISGSPPKSISPSCDYILLTSSKGLEDEDWTKNKYIIGIIVYCLELNQKKKKQIEKTCNNKVPITATNNFSKMISLVVELLGYGNPNTYEEIDESEENRFILHTKKITNPEQQFSNPQQYLIRGHRILLKMFRLPIQIEETPISKLKLLLEDELRAFLKNHKLPIIEKEFTKIQSAETLQDLCRASVYYYTLQKPALYYNLNLILKNIRYVKFQQDFGSIRIFAFLLLLNYFFVYSGDHVLPSNLLYRYTDYQPNNYSIGSIITVTSFYSVSGNIQLTTSKNKTKMVIHPLGSQDCLSLSSRFPAYLYSAFPKQQEYLYAPFTRFKIMSMVDKTIHLQELPRNIFLSRIMDINLLYNQESQGYAKPISQYDWEVKYQLKYESFKHIPQKIKQQTLRKVYYNLGALNFQNARNYKLAIQYFQRGLTIAINANLQPQIAIAYNNIALAQYKLGHYADATNNYARAQNIVEKTEPMDTTFLINLYNNLASVRESEEKYQEAIKLYEKGLSILTNSQVNNPLLEATLLNNIAFCKSSVVEDKTQVIKLFEIVQQKYTMIYGDQYFDQNVACEENLAQTYQKIGMLHQAYQHLQNAERIQSHIGEPVSNEILNIFLSIAKLLNQMTNYQQSSQYFQKALEMSEKLNGLYHRTTAIICHNIASVEQSMDNYEESLRYFDKCIEIVTTPYRPENNDIFEMAIELRQFLVQSMQKQKQFEVKVKKNIEQNNRKNEQWQRVIKQKYKDNPIP